MDLKEARRLFHELRKIDRIDVVESHVIDDHPEREYTIDEIINLVKAKGHFEDTTDRAYRGVRFFSAGERVKL